MFGELSLQHTQRPSLTALEERCVPATTASFVSGLLHISGDEHDQDIKVTQTGPSSFRVSGLTGGTQTFQGVKSISIVTATGLDIVHLDGLNNGGFAPLSSVSVAGWGNLVVYNDLSITGGFTVSGVLAKSVTVVLKENTTIGNGFNVTGDAGFDVVLMDPGATVIGRTLLNLGGGRNTTSLVEARLDGALTIVGAGGNDDVVLWGVEIGDSNAGSMDLNLGGGSDTVELLGLTVSGSGGIACTGTLGLDVQSTEFQGHLEAGGRDVRADVVNSRFGGRLRFVTGTGPDVIQVTGCQVGGDFTAQTSTGGDFVTVEYTTVGGNATIKGRGLAEVTVRGSTFANGLVIDSNFMGSTSSPVTIWLEQITLKGGLEVRTGDGKDTLTLRNASISLAGTATVRIAMGNGNDRVDLGSSVFNAGVELNGGLGTDSLIKGGARFRWDPKIISFENVS